MERTSDFEQLLLHCKMEGKGIRPEQYSINWGYRTCDSNPPIQRKVA